MAHTTSAARGSGSPTSQTLRLGARGRLVLPAAVRRQLGLQEGDRLVLLVEGEDELRLVRARRRVRRLRGLLSEQAQGRDLVAELLQERRAEAADE